MAARTSESDQNSSTSQRRTQWQDGWDRSSDQLDEYDNDLTQLFWCGFGALLVAIVSIPLSFGALFLAPLAFIPSFGVSCCVAHFARHRLDRYGVPIALLSAMISYVSMVIWFLIFSSAFLHPFVTFPCLLTILSFGVWLAFAEGSRFMKNVVISAVFFTLLGSVTWHAILRSREAARRIEYTKNLAELGMEMQSQQVLKRPSDNEPIVPYGLSGKPANQLHNPIDEEFHFAEDWWRHIPKE